MPRTHGANKSILFAQSIDPFEVTLDEFAQIKNALFAHVYKPCLHEQINQLLLAQVSNPYEVVRVLCK